MENQNQPVTSDQPPVWPPVEPFFPMGKRELIFGAVMIVLGMALANFTMFGGGNLGFAIALLGCLTAAVCYLRAWGLRGGWYSRTLLALCAVIIPGFARSDDGFVKLVLVCFLFVGVNLGLAGAAGKNLWDLSGITSLLDCFRVFFGLGFGRVAHMFRGVRHAVRTGGETVKKSGAVLLGALLSVPVLAVMIPLLMRSDAAFEGLLALLPEFDLTEIWFTVIFGAGAACVLFTRSVALVHEPKAETPAFSARKGLNSLTVNTVLGAVCALYAVYLMSQLAYFVGGFSGILPAGYSLAEYARRGFFEMAWLCAINLSVMVLAISFTQKRAGKTPLATRCLCLFIGLVTLFLVTAAGAKMVLYIGAYGMTRLRILTMVIMAFLGLTTAVVSLWLFAPKLPYMKVVVVSALVMGAAVLWADVDGIVAGYNVDAYLSGRLQSVDVIHLSTLGSGAVPHLDRLAREAEDDMIREHAANILEDWAENTLTGDLRAWNLTDAAAAELLPDWYRSPDTEQAANADRDLPIPSEQ